MHYLFISLFLAVLLLGCTCSAPGEKGAAESPAQLVNELASLNQAPKVTSDMRHLLEPQLYSPTFIEEHQKRVWVAYGKLSGMGKEVIPALLNHIEDDRYAFSRNSTVLRNYSVGEACRELLVKKVNAPFEYKNCEQYLNPHASGKELRKWWQASKDKSLREIRLISINWTVARERLRNHEVAAERVANLLKYREQELSW